MDELVSLAVSRLNEMPLDEFEELLEKDFFAELEAFLPLLPKNYTMKIKKMSFRSLKSIISKDAPQKARLIEKKGKWKEIEAAFERLKKKI